MSIKHHQTRACSELFPENPIRLEAKARQPDSPTARRLEPALDGVARVRQRRKQAIQLFFEGDRVPLGLGKRTKDVTN